MRESILVSFQKELRGSTRAVPTWQSLPACGRTRGCFVTRLTIFTDNWDLWRLSCWTGLPWPSPTCVFQEVRPGGRSCIQWWLKTTAWGRATEWPWPTTQKALLTRWRSVRPSRCNYITLKSCCHSWLPFNIGRKNERTPVLMSFKRNHPQFISFSHLLELSSPLGKSRSPKALWICHPRPKMAATYPAISYSEWPGIGKLSCKPKRLDTHKVMGHKGTFSCVTYRVLTLTLIEKQILFSKRN